jgi:hypothetical protein
MHRDYIKNDPHGIEARMKALGWSQPRLAVAVGGGCKQQDIGRLLTSKPNREPVSSKYLAKALEALDAANANPRRDGIGDMHQAAPAPRRESMSISATLIFAAVEEALLTADCPPGRAAKIAAAVRLALSVHSTVVDMTPEEVVRWTVRRDVGLLLANEKGRA